MRLSLAMISVLLLSSAAGPVRAASQSDWDDCIQTRDSDRGIAACTRVIQDDSDTTSNRAVAFYNRGYAYSAKRDRDRAIADYGEAIRLDPGYAHAYANRGLIYSAKGELDRAIADYDAAIQIEFNFAPLYNARGLAYRAKGDFDRAIADHDEAIRIDPKLVPAYINRGSAYRAKAEFSRAIADYDAAIRLDQTDAFAYYGRGVANLYNGALPSALADFNDASDLEPDYAYPVLWLDIANKRSDLPSRLAQATAQIDMTRWPAPVIRLFLGQTTPAAVLAAADDPDANRKRGQVCQANFYSGELALLQQQKGEALPQLRLAAGDCRPDSTEWIAANAELKALGAAQ